VPLGDERRAFRGTITEAQLDRLVRRRRALTGEPVERARGILLEVQRILGRTLPPRSE